MKKRLLVLSMLLFTLAACHQLAEEWDIAADSFGPLKIGMTAADAEKITNKQILQEPLSKTTEATCRYAAFKGEPKQVRLMTHYNQIVRIDIKNPRYKTNTGVHVGMPVNQVISLYPNRLKVQSDKYSGSKGWKNLVVIPKADQFHRLIFDTDGQKIINIRLGKVPEVEYVEGCL